MRILIAEDDGISRKLLQRSLEKLGHEVVAARDGREALEYFQREPFPFVITDWMMPEMDGLNLVKSIREIQAKAYVYIIMLTAKSAKNDFIEGMEAGADDFIAKPFDRDELRVRLQAGERILRLEKGLQHKNEELERVNDRMKHDLDAAAKIQVSLLPSEPPALADVKVRWRFNPCDELAGDIFNVFNLDEKHLGLYILDVSGHGVPAALLAVTLSRLLSPVLDDSSIVKKRSATPPHYQIASPSEVAAQLNKSFQLEPEHSQYFTLIYGVLNLETHSFRFISAGHPPIIYLSRKTSSRIIETPGLPIGILEENSYQEHTIQLLPGDRIYLYSDGIAEAENPDGEQFGTARMLETLQSRADAPLEESIETLVGYAAQWCQPQTIGDDVSVLAVEVCA